MSATYTARSHNCCGIPYKIEKIKSVECRHLQRDLLTELLTYPSSYLPPHFALHADQKTKKRSLAPWPTQLSYAMATTINYSSQHKPCGALTIAIVGRIMPATASKTARSPLLSSEFRGPFIQRSRRYNSAPPMRWLMSPQSMQLIYRRGRHHYSGRCHRIMPLPQQQHHYFINNHIIRQSDILKSNAPMLHCLRRRR